MQHIIDQITDNLSGLIKEDLPAYTPKELLKAGIPSFVVERMRLITEDRLRKQLVKPESEWANMESELVDHAWEDYLECVISSSHIPKEDLYETLNVVVKEAIEVLLEPRRRMAEYLFRDNDTLGADEIGRRCSRLTIYKHIGMAIPMYMKKKGLKEISLERCKRLIHNLDEKLVASYSANDWAEKLEMLFIIFGGKVEPAMFVTFFKDKGLNRAARLFSTLHEPLNRRDFIAMLTSEGTEDLAGDESDKDYLSNVAADTPAEKEDELVESFFGDYKEDADQPLVNQFTAEDEISENEMEAILKDIEGEEDIFDSDSLNALFATEQADEDDETADISTAERSDQDKKEFRTNLTSILEQAKSSYESIGSDEEEEPKQETEPEPEVEEVVEMDELVAEEEEVTEEESDEEEGDDDSPMWKQYLSEEQMAVMMRSRRGEQESQEEAGPEETSKSGLLEEMGDQAEHFKKSVFGGSKKKFDKAIAEIDECLAWGQAAELLQKDIFEKNKIDMFSDEAVEFTDFLQNYFNEHK